MGRKRMNFQRKNINPYETLRIGERVSAIEFKTIHIIVISTYMERNLDGFDRKKESQTIVSIKKDQMNLLMKKLQEGTLSK